MASIIKQEFRHFLEAAEIMRNKAAYRAFNSDNDEEAERHYEYWRGKVDGMKFVIDVGDKLVTDKIIRLLNQKGFTEAADYIKHREESN